MFQKREECSPVLCPVLGAPEPHDDSGNRGWNMRWGKTEKEVEAGYSVSQRERSQTSIEAPLRLIEK